MAEVERRSMVTTAKLGRIADAIREKRAESVSYTLDEMPEAILGIPSGGGGGVGAQITVVTTSSQFYGQTVSLSNGVDTITQKFSNSGVAAFSGIEWEGNLTASVEYEGRTFSTTIVVKTRYVSELNYMIPSWSEATDEQISAVLTSYYAGSLSLADIQEVWHVGDERTVHLSAMSPSYQLSDSHREQDVKMVILDFEHDTLTTPINGKTKALLTFQQKDCLMDAECAAGTKYGTNNTENGVWGTDYYVYGDFNTFPRTLWLRNTYYNALPSTFRMLLKETTRKWANELGEYGNKTICNEKIFLPSAYEMGSPGGYGDPCADEQSVYAYYVVPPNYTVAPNTSKKPLWEDSSSFTSAYWTRTSLRAYSYNFIFVQYDGGLQRGGGNTPVGLAPAGCL